MPAQKLNYLVVYKNESQVFGSASKHIALESPPPANTPLEEKRVFFVTYQPDNGTLSVHAVPQEEVLNAEIKYKKPNKKKDKDEEA